MKLVFTSYASANEFNEPAQWLKRIEGYTGILESLSRTHNVTGIERINYEGEYQQNGVHYIFIRQKQKVVRFPTRIHSLVKRLQPDVVFVNGFIFPLQIIQLKLRLGRRVKIILIHRADRPFNGIKRWLQKIANSCVDAYLFSSLDFKNEWKPNIDEKKMHEVIQVSSVFSIMDRMLAQSATKVAGHPVFLWVGRLDTNKDPLVVVSAFLKFSDEYRDAKLYMIYQSEDLLTDLQQLISLHEHGADRVRLVGRIDHQELKEWYNSADFVISGSHYESGGAAVVEAMSCGCIPVLTNIESFRAVSGRGSCGLLYEAGDENDLLRALRKTKQMDIETQRQKVLRQFNDELSFEAIARKMEAVISSL